MITQEEQDIIKFLNLPVRERNRIRLQRLIEKAEEHKENKRLDLARNTLDIVYAVRELKKRLSLTQK